MCACLCVVCVFANDAGCGIYDHCIDMTVI